VRSTVLQILFLIGAWKRGWKAKALIPIGLAFGVGVILGVSGVPLDGRESILLVPDIVSTIVLAVMCVVPPASATAPVAALKAETHLEQVQVLARN
jgi:hypothetical protein